jgi:hypothetical protein
MRSLLNAGGGDDRKVVRHRVRSESTPSDRMRSISASIASRSNKGRGPSRNLAPPAFALRRDITRDDAVEALFASLLGDKRQAELFAHHRCQKAADRVGLPASCLHYGGNGRALADFSGQRYGGGDGTGFYKRFEGESSAIATCIEDGLSLFDPFTV